MRQLEAEILHELKIVANNKKLRQKDIMEWASGSIKAHDGEEVYHLPELKMDVAIKVMPNAVLSGAAIEVKPKPPILPTSRVTRDDQATAKRETPTKGRSKASS